MAESKPVFVVGAGPVGLGAAAALLRRGVPVTVLEAGAELSGEMRGSTFHAPTLDILDDLGAMPATVAQGLVAPRMQYRGRGQEVIAEFDFGVLAGETRHPHRLQCEQFKLIRILHRLLLGRPGHSLRLGARVVDGPTTATGLWWRWPTGRAAATLPQLPTSNLSRGASR